MAGELEDRAGRAGARRPEGLRRGLGADACSRWCRRRRRCG